VLLDSERKVLLKQSVACLPQHVTAAVKRLPVAPDAVRVAIEPVLGWRWFTGLLIEAGMDVHIANPIKTRLIAESRLKHDTLDALMLAELLKSGFFAESYRAPDDIVRLRSLVRERKYLVHLRINVLCRMHGVIGRRGLHLTLHNPTRVAGRKEVEASGDAELIEMLRLVEELEAHIKPLDARIGQFARSLQVPKLLMTMPGVGSITALAVYAEVADFSRFPAAEKLAAYAGLVPSQRSSGTHVRHGHITKMGTEFLRTAMIEAAFRIRPTSDERLYGFYQRLVPSCGARRARVALARKMLTIFWFMVTRNAPYAPLSSESTPKRDDLVCSLAHH
jgi:transposase